MHNNNNEIFFAYSLLIGMHVDWFQLKLELSSCSLCFGCMIEMGKRIRIPIYAELMLLVLVAVGIIAGIPDGTYDTTL